MKISTRKYLFGVTLILLTLCLATDASTLQERAFDEEALAAYQQQGEFRYGANAAQGSTWLARILYRITQRFFGLLTTPGGLEFGRGFLYFLLAAVILGAVVLIVQMRYGKVLVGKSDRERPMSLALDREENANYAALLREAQQSGELKLAARYLFLLTLQRMNQQGLVQWRKWKTSHDYALEIAVDKRQAYLSLSEFFESSWFGGREPSAQELQDYQVIAKQLTDA